MSKLKTEIILTLLVMVVFPIGACSFITGELQNPFNWVASGKATYVVYLLLMSAPCFQLFNSRIR